MFSLLIILVILLLVVLIGSFFRIGALRQRIEDQEEILRRLTERVYRIEQGAGGDAAAPIAPETFEPISTPEPVAAVSKGPSAFEPFHALDVDSASEGPPEAGPVQPASGGGPGLRGEEWEAVIGANWLNKLGVLVLVIGISLFLGYSLTQLGPAGKIQVGLAVSLLLLGAGVVLERRALYRAFGRGLIGGGWASLYFTTYAMHGLEASRVLPDPLAAMLLLLAVACGMIAHSVRYRSQSVTGVAFFVAFITLNVSPLTGFALAASVPLAAALLWVAVRFSWSVMAVCGLVLTYGTYALAHDSTGPVPAAGPPMLWVYWLMFEAYDLLDLRKNGLARRVTRTLLPLNACGFAGAALLSWPRTPASGLFLFLAVASMAYIASSILRAGILSLRQEDEPEARSVLAGGYREAITVSAVFAAASIFNRFDGTNIEVALLLEGEFLVLGGLMLGARYLTTLGGAVFVLPVFSLFTLRLFEGGSTTVAGLELMKWTPLAILMAAVFFLNRALLGAGALYTHAGSAIVSLVMAYELPPQHVGLAWTVLGGALLEWGLRSRRSEFRYQAYVLGVLGFVALWARNIFELGIGPETRTWVPLAICAVLYYAGAVRLFRLPPGRVNLQERTLPAFWGALFGAVLLLALAGKTSPEAWTAFWWSVTAAGLIEAGARLQQPFLRLQGALVTALVFFRVLETNLDVSGDFFGLSLRVAGTVPVALILYAMHARVRRAGDRAGWERWEAWMPAAFAVLATAVLAGLLQEEVSGRLLTAAWGIQGFLLLPAGFLLRERVLRLSGLILLLVCITKLFAYDLRHLDAPGRIISFIVLGLLLLAVSWIYTRFREQIRRLLG